MSNKDLSFDKRTLEGYTTSFPHTTAVCSNARDSKASSASERKTDVAKPNPRKNNDAPRD